MSKAKKQGKKQKKADKKANKAGKVEASKTKTVPTEVKASGNECGHEATAFCDVPDAKATGHETQTFRCLRMTGHGGEHFLGIEVVALDGQRVEGK